LSLKGDSLVHSFLQRTRSAALTGLIVLLVAGTAFAQTGRIEGTVRAASGDPIAGAQVTVVEAKTATTTDEAGRYAFEGVPVGIYTVRITAIGFQPTMIADRKISAGQPITVNASLEQAMLRIEGVVVTGVNELSSALASGQTVAAEDLEDVDQVHMLFWTHYDLGQFSEAQRWCEEGARRSPDDYRFTQCRLWMLITAIRHPDIDVAWDLVRRVEMLAPQGLMLYYGHESRMIVGGVIARAGLTDSASHVLSGAEADDDVDPARTLLRVEAVMRILGREYDRALDLLEEYRRLHPEYSFEVEGDLHWFWGPLRNDPRFKAIR
jgi:tetratricopeptide (TPR) repeat protein